MKFLVDECVGRRVFDWFKNNSYDVLFVKDEFEGASDDVCSKGHVGMSEFL